METYGIKTKSLIVKVILVLLVIFGVYTYLAAHLQVNSSGNTLEWSSRLNTSQMVLFGFSVNTFSVSGIFCVVGAAICLVFLIYLSIRSKLVSNKLVRIK